MKMDIVKSIKDKKYFSNKETLVLALSGGVDSMVLFHILKALDLDLKIIVAHVNHNKRNESFNEYNEIQNICIDKSIPFEGLLLQHDLQGNFHNESRKQRYDFFYATALKYNASKIVTAHHSDDQLETVFMRITRGSSFGGYSGIKPIREFNDILLVRPLIDFSKNDLIGYAETHKLTYFTDKSNDSSIYTRNRFRKEIIPLLKDENPNLENQVKQFSSYITLADDFINKSRINFTDKFYINNKVNLHEFNSVEDILKIYIIKFIINSKTCDTVEVSYQQFSDIIELLGNETPNIKYNLSKGYFLIKEYDTFYIKKDKTIDKTMIQIDKEGVYEISPNLRYIFSFQNLGISRTDCFEICYNDKVFPLYLRNRKNGDKMSLQVGTKKVKDILIDQKIPASIRETLILLATHDKVLWIPTIKKSLQDKTCTKKLYIYEVR